MRTTPAQIETEEHHKPAIRTVHKIAAFLKVPEQKLMALAGLLQVKDVQFQNAALKFAARSAQLKSYLERSTPIWRRSSSSCANGKEPLP
jgi:hypothetical protein